MVSRSLMDREDSTETGGGVEEDQQALLNLQRNIANIERSMSASQLERAEWGRGRQVRRRK